MNIREYLKDKKILADGSFGTYYAGKYEAKRLPELDNLEHPERVETIHREYLDAGAVLLRTNTFASNTVILGGGFEEVRVNIEAAFQCAKRASEGRDAFIAGDIGPIPMDDLSVEKIEEQYVFIAETFAGLGVDAILFETFADIGQILPAIKRIREISEEIFIWVQFAVNQFGYGDTGLSAKKLIGDAAKLAEIDAAGLNCGVGPGHMKQILDRIALPEGKFFSTLPNAGYPERGSKLISFGNTPEYFSLKLHELADMGADIIGGCCGTNPSFIRDAKGRIGLSQASGRRKAEEGKEGNKEVRKQGFLYDENGKRKEGKLIAVELAPPFDIDDERLLESAHLLKNSKVDVLTFPDSPSGRTRVDSVLMAGKVRRETGLAVMPHICCRDKNALAMRSLILGAQINDIHDALIITGDPLPTLARQTVKAVFNFDSTGLMSIAREMNEEVLSEHPLCYGGAINQGRTNLEQEIRRVKRKLECGAEFFMTQPVFSEEDAARIRRIKDETGAVILCGIMPLVSRRNALFMKNEISGVNVPQEVLERYPEGHTREEGEQAGVLLARKMIALTEDFADGYYFTFPFNRVHMLEEIMK